jgi:hypothetical protein
VIFAVVETLANDLELIKGGLHIGRFITATVDTKADRTNIEALYTDLESSSTQINVIIVRLVFCYIPLPALTPLLLYRNGLNILDPKTNFLGSQ